MRRHKFGAALATLLLFTLNSPSVFAETPEQTEARVFDKKNKYDHLAQLSEVKTQAQAAREYLARQIHSETANDDTSVEQDIDDHLKEIPIASFLDYYDGSEFGDVRIVNPKSDSDSTVHYSQTVNFSPIGVNTSTLKTNFDSSGQLISGTGQLPGFYRISNMKFTPGSPTEAGLEDASTTVSFDIKCLSEGKTNLSLQGANISMEYKGHENDSRYSPLQRVLFKNIECSKDQSEIYPGFATYAVDMPDDGVESTFHPRADGQYYQVLDLIDHGFDNGASKTTMVLNVINPDGQPATKGEVVHLKPGDNSYIRVPDQATVDENGHITFDLKTVGAGKGSLLFIKNKQDEVMDMMVVNSKDTHPPTDVH